MAKNWFKASRLLMRLRKVVGNDQLVLSALAVVVGAGSGAGSHTRTRVSSNIRTGQFRDESDVSPAPERIRSAFGNDIGSSPGRSKLRRRRRE